jgi:hypothetical protein
MREIALHLLDIAENSVAANATLIEISVLEDLKNDRLKAVIVDNGKGMDTDTVLRVSDPFVTTRTTRKVGLGIPLLKPQPKPVMGILRLSRIWARVPGWKLNFKEVISIGCRSVTLPAQSSHR